MRRTHWNFGMEWKGACPLALAVALLLPACGSDTTSPPVVVTGVAPVFAQLAVGPRFSCGLDRQGRGYCWGAGTLGELANGARQSSADLVPVRAPGVVFARVSVGTAHACGVDITGQAWCWGWGVLDQLGIGGPTVGGPYAVAGPLLEAVSAGWYHNCGIAQDGSAWCWGSNAKGQLGDGTYTNRGSPVAVLGGLRFRSLSAGGTHTCGIAYDGGVYCWGLNASGQLGNGGTVDALSPRAIGGGVSFVAVSAGYQHTCGEATSGAVYCWGSNVRGELGQGDVTPEGLPGRTLPDSVRTTLHFASVDAGYARTCALGSDGAASCWGAGESGQLGSGTARDERLPVAVLRPAADPTGGGLVYIGAAGLTYGCGLYAAGTVFCWGQGNEGQLGRAAVTSSRPVPLITGAPLPQGALGSR